MLESALCLLVFISLASAARAQKRPGDLAGMSIEELMQVQVTSASKKQEKLSETAAAMYVITQEDIRRSGMTSIPELLRMVPGLEVAHLDANRWAISARGFNGRFANKMLVLIDGRTVYTPLFSGVHWDVQDTLLEDIERIEVIRGPGATLWGANAVNGVINIITKQAKDTQGALVTVGGGNQERGFGGVRYGGELPSGAYYRFFAKYFNRDAFADASGQPAADGWNILRGGFRTDWTLGGRDSLTVQGDFYNGGAGETSVALVSLSPPQKGQLNGRTGLLGGSALARWNHAFSSRSDTTLQLYYDRADRTDPHLSEVIHTVDLDFDHHFAPCDRHDIVWGFGYRFTTDQTAGSLSISFNPSSLGVSLYTGFVQDEITLLRDRFRLTLGTKLEHNAYNGFEAQPNLRLLWTATPRHALWAAISRAVRTPARSDVGLRRNTAAFPGRDGLLNLVSSLGNPNLKSDELLAYELGYRAQLSKRLSLDVATFYNRYDRLRTTEPGAPFFETSPAPPHLLLPQVFDNKLHGETHGVELTSNWRVTHRWTLSGGYSLLRTHLHFDPSSQDISSVAKVEGTSPRQQAQFRSRFDLPEGLELDTSVYFVGQLAAQQIPSYTRLDMRIGWRPAERLELSVASQNMLDHQHAEFSPGSGLSPIQITRSVFGKLTWRF